jgi:hypothetical protein
MNQVDMVHTIVSGGRKFAVVGYRKGKQMLDQVFKLSEQRCIECGSALRFAERIYYNFDVSDRIIELQFFCDEECAGVADDDDKDF